MITRRAGWLGTLVLALGTVFTPVVWAQQASGISGVVHDTSKAVLPGVTVEAASPALIERVRVVVTDAQGRYSLVGLNAGTYTVSFTMTGFSTVQRPGIVLTAGFTATIDAELKVGALEETITVSGASPLVDTQNVRTQTAVSDDLIRALPVGATAMAALMVRITPGMTIGLSGASDVGGSSGAFWADYLAVTQYHGKADGAPKSNLDGMRVDGYGSAGGAGGAGYVNNLNAVDELVLETSGVSAESNSSGVVANAIPKSGSNTLAIQASQTYTNSHFQSDNAVAGTAVPSRLDSLWYVGIGIGGPIKQNKAWFYTAPRWDHSKAFVPRFFNLTQGTPFFTPDTSRPAYKGEAYRSSPVRVTWQATTKDKVNTYVDYQPYCGCARDVGQAGEANNNRKGFTIVAQGSWQRPVTSRLLLEAGASMLRMRRNAVPLAEVDSSTISIQDTQNGFTYNAGTALGANPWRGTYLAKRYFQRAGVSYITGSHAFKVGVQNEFGSLYWQTLINQDISYIFRGSSPGVATPLSVVQYATPLGPEQNVKASLGVYAQDQWAIGRLTLNLGLRYDYHNAYVPEQHAPATRFVPARTFAAVRDVPIYNDLSPRLGAAYDLFGNDRTALKMSLNKYVFSSGLEVAQALNPLGTAANSVTRDWNDTFYPVGDARRGNYVPDCDLNSSQTNGECGQWQDLNFGGVRNLTQWDDAVREGFGVRLGLWDLTAEVQHQLTDRVSLVAGYYRNWSFNQRVTENTLVIPGDYSPFSITAPVDARLPGGGGYAVNGLYDLSPTKVGQVANLVTKASNFGEQTLVNDFIGLNFRTRFGNGIYFGGGLDAGRSAADNCFVVDSPEQQRFCRVVTGFKNQLQLKFHGAYPLPGGFVVSAVYNDIVGPAILANYSVTRAQIEGLGRPLSTSSRTVALIAPNSVYEPRIRTIDLQFGKSFKLGRVRFQPEVAAYNVGNTNAVIVRNNTYGPQWGPQETKSGRLIEFNSKLSF